MERMRHGYANDTTARNRSADGGKSPDQTDLSHKDHETVNVALADGPASG